MTVIGPFLWSCKAKKKNLDEINLLTKYFSYQKQLSNREIASTLPAFKGNNFI
jgi:hypothetical protein